MFALPSHPRRRLMFVTDDTESGAGAAVVESVVEVDASDAEALGETGQRALDAMKADLKAAREELAVFRKGAGDKRGTDAVRQRLEDGRKAQEALAALTAKTEGREAEYATDQANRKVETDALAKANTRILSAEIRALAAGKLADPKDALKFLDLATFEVGDDGEVDTAAITAAIEDLVKSKSYLAAQGGKTETVFESPGSHRKGAVGQLSQADLKNMNPAQINAARAEGRLNDLLGIKH